MAERDIFVEAASTAKEADADEALRSFFKNCEDAQPRANGVTVGTLFYSAIQFGADFSQWKQLGISDSDNEDSRRAAFRRASKALVASGKVIKRDNKYTIAD